MELEGGIVEFAVYGAPGELPFLSAVRAVAQGALVEVRTQEVADDWRTAGASSTARWSWKDG